MFTAGRFIEKTKFMAKQMHFAFPYGCFGKAVSGQNQVLVFWCPMPWTLQATFLVLLLGLL